MKAASPFVDEVFAHLDTLTGDDRLDFMQNVIQHPEHKHEITQDRRFAAIATSTAFWEELEAWDRRKRGLS